MFKILTITSLIVAASFSSVKADDSICPMIGNLSRSVMKLRQAGAPMDVVMANIGKVYNADDPETPYMRKLVIAAYEFSLYTTAEVKQQVIEEFANRTMAACYANT